MLIRFVIENFLSFNKEAELSFIANKERRKPDHIVKTADINLLKTSVIYGANAVGKSNLIKGITLAQKIILKGIDKLNTINCHFRFKESNISKPSKFSFEIKIGDKFYNYGFGIILNDNTIVEEWLYEIGRTKDKMIFERFRNDNGAHKVEYGISLDKEVKKRFEVYRADIEYSDVQLFLSELNRKSIAHLPNIEPFIDVFNWFKYSLIVLFPTSRFNGLDFVGDDSEMTDVFNVFLDTFKTGIDDVLSEKIDIEKIDIPKHVYIDLEKDLEKNTILILEHDGKRYSFTRDINDKRLVAKKIGLVHKTHEGNKVIFDIENESDGTQRLFDFIPALHQLIRSNKVFIIDELDRSLHSKLTYEIINLFIKLTNENESQLIVTTHESLLLDLDLFRRDEIWFIEKENESSKLYSLDEFKVRNDKIVRKDYLLGRYGAIPLFKSYNNIKI